MEMANQLLEEELELQQPPLSTGTKCILREAAAARPSTSASVSVKSRTATATAPHRRAPHSRRTAAAAPRSSAAHCTTPHLTAQHHTAQHSTAAQQHGANAAAGQRALRTDYQCCRSRLVGSSLRSEPQQAASVQRGGRGADPPSAQVDCELKLTQTAPRSAMLG